MAIQQIGIGSAPNDGTGDSIRTAFDKANQNFSFLDSARQNLVTGNLSATGLVTFNTSNATPNFWTGQFYINGVQIATVGTLFSGGTVANPTQFTNPSPATSTTTGALVVTGGVGITGALYTTSVYAQSLSVTNDISAATLTVGSTVLLQGAVTASQGLTVSGGILNNSGTGNISAGTAPGTGVDGYQGTFTQVQGTILTNAQPFVTSLGTLSGLASSGNLVANNITANINLQSLTLAVVANAKVGTNLTVGTTAVIGGNLTAGNVTGGIGTFSNLTVQTVPTNQSVTNKSYVTATVVGFAIGLGS